MQVIAVRDGKQAYFFMPTSISTCSEWFEVFKLHMIQRDLKVKYSIGSMLGKGNFATVFDAQHKGTGKWYAVKTVDKRTVL